jgi:ribosomal protein L21E
VVAPPPFNETDVPAQTDEELDVAVTVGNVSNITAVVAVFVQPAELVPVTVYVAVAVGIKLTPLVTPPLQEYVDAPPPFNVTNAPAQTDDALDVAVTVGNVSNITVVVAVFVQPAALVPVTVYVAVAVGIKLTPLVIPPLQVYVDAPPPFNETDVPAQTDDAVAVEVTVGNRFTVIVVVAVFVQPAELVPVTVYVAVEVGIKLTPFVTPPLQAYVVAPPPFNVSDVPAQTDEALGLAVTIGNRFTVIVFVAVFVQPAALVPVTVYVAVAVGIKLTPLVIPPLQVYVDAPTPFNITDEPAQTDDAVELAVTVGNKLTVIVVVVVFVQPAALVPVTV